MIHYLFSVLKRVTDIRKKNENEIMNKENQEKVTTAGQTYRIHLNLDILQEALIGYFQELFFGSLCCGNLQMKNSASLLHHDTILSISQFVQS